MEEKKTDEMQLVVFVVDGEKFGIEIDLVLEIIKLESVTRMPNVDDFVMGVINLRGKIVVVVDTALKLGMSSMNKTLDSRVLIIKAGDETVGLFANRCDNVFNVNINMIKEPPKIILDKLESDFIKGVVMKNDDLIILLDINKFLVGQDFALNKKLS